MRKRIVLFMLSMMVLSGCGDNQSLNNPTTEEIIAYEKSITREYEVISVTQYLIEKKDNFGLVREKEVKFAFTYINEIGELVTCDGFKDTEYGLTNVCVGTENKCVIKDFGVNVYRTLYITEECLGNIY